MQLPLFWLPLPLIFLFLGKFQRWVSLSLRRWSHWRLWSCRGNWLRGAVTHPPGTSFQGSIRSLLDSAGREGWIKTLATKTFRSLAQTHQECWRIKRRCKIANAMNVNESAHVGEHPPPHLQPQDEDKSCIFKENCEEITFAPVPMLLPQIEVEMRRKPRPELLFGRATWEQTHSEDSFFGNLLVEYIYVGIY